jgi:hypothetical protein
LEDFQHNQRPWRKSCWFSVMLNKVVEQR